MPTYRSITISLVSQFDILTIPEFAPPPPDDADPFASESTQPTLIKPSQSLVSVYIPTYPSSQFWLSYSISPPYPPHALFYFKLLLNGIHVVSWGCGEKDGYKGRTMFGLFDARMEGNRSLVYGEVERRMLCFTRPDEPVDGKKDGKPKLKPSIKPSRRSQYTKSERTLNDMMEVRVYRSRGRKRIHPELVEFTKTPLAAQNNKQNIHGSISLADAGKLRRKDPQQFFKYALLDPTDRPFATFRYYYRSWAELETLGVISPTRAASRASTSTTISTIDPYSLSLDVISPISPSKVPEPTKDSSTQTRSPLLPSLPSVDSPSPLYIPLFNTINRAKTVPQILLTPPNGPRSLPTEALKKTHTTYPYPPPSFSLKSNDENTGSHTDQARDFQLTATVLPTLTYSSSAPTESLTTGRSSSSLSSYSLDVCRKLSFETHVASLFAPRTTTPSPLAERESRRSTRKVEKGSRGKGESDGRGAEGVKRVPSLGVLRGVLDSARSRRGRREDDHS